MSAQKSPQEEVKIFTPKHCPQPFDAGTKILKGETMDFDEKSLFPWMTKISPILLGEPLIKITAAETKGNYACKNFFRLGFWHLGHRRAIFCNQVHPGLFPYFMFLNGYGLDSSRKNQLYRTLTWSDLVLSIISLCSKVNRHENEELSTPKPSLSGFTRLMESQGKLDQKTSSYGGKFGAGFLGYLLASRPIRIEQLRLQGFGKQLRDVEADFDETANLLKKYETK